MLLEFGGKNFYSFKEGFQVNLKKGKDVSKILAIKGANASGKTNILKALTFIIQFNKYSFSSSPKEKINISSFFNNNLPISLYIIFRFKEVEYKYEVQLTDEKVLKEQFFEKNQLIIERIENKITINKVSNNAQLLNNIILRDNASLLSTVIQYELDIQETNNIFKFFHPFFSNISNLGLISENILEYSYVSRIYHEQPLLLEFVKEFIKKSDIGIKDIIIKDRYDEETKSTVYFPIFLYDIDQKEEFLVYSEQSSGTKMLYSQLILYKIVLDLGGILILDELDINLHPDLIPPLLYFFKSKKLNKNGAQLLFTTHNTEIMDKLTKYNIVLVNKEENESYIYRLDETGEIIRNDRPISTIYNSGRLGGKPKIELDHE